MHARVDCPFYVVLTINSRSFPTPLRIKNVTYSNSDYFYPDFTMAANQLPPLRPETSPDNAPRRLQLHLEPANENRGYSARHAFWEQDMLEVLRRVYRLEAATREDRSVHLEASNEHRITCDNLLARLISVERRLAMERDLMSADDENPSFGEMWRALQQQNLEIEALKDRITQMVRIVLFLYYTLSK